MLNLEYKKQVPFSAKQMFDLVMDIEHYSEFLPWCEKAEIMQRVSDNELVADLEIKFKSLKAKYTSTISAISNPPNYSIDIKSSHMFFNYFISRWDFIENDKGSLVIFKFNLKMKLSFFERFLVSSLDTVGNEIVELFTQRAKKLYKIK
ncbi:putative cytoplasmic protein [Candidatus Phycorickettsia trachydisci]|uniref:Putative cytoplasmic protein n=1 Tax=Candidatus Phycorickettsia trachydisci TaxID=2115978 RepID=A0A2P1P772_9RICK|nr:type II toxin-antitoxin system RatA family toxin [Candidatus Phycorickettsia trachydisci]AVP87118.1 putative cytoplasmic protein [Candidatus Phycorickettsia trachydisci]